MDFICASSEATSAIKCFTQQPCDDDGKYSNKIHASRCARAYTRNY